MTERFTSRCSRASEMETTNVQTELKRHIIYTSRSCIYTWNTYGLLGNQSKAGPVTVIPKLAF